MTWMRMRRPARSWLTQNRRASPARTEAAWGVLDLEPGARIALHGEPPASSAPA